MTVHDIDPTERRQLLRLRWPELSTDEFERLCEIWDGGRIDREGKIRGPKIGNEKKQKFKFPEIATADILVRDLFNQSFDPT